MVKQPGKNSREDAVHSAGKVSSRISPQGEPASGANRSLAGLLHHYKPLGNPHIAEALRLNRLAAAKIQSKR